MEVSRRCSSSCSAGVDLQAARSERAAAAERALRRMTARTKVDDDEAPLLERRGVAFRKVRQRVDEVELVRRVNPPHLRFPREDFEPVVATVLVAGVVATHECEVADAETSEVVGDPLAPREIGLAWRQ